MIGFNDLPLEVIINIYKYLSVNEINRLRLTCHHLYSASTISMEYLDTSILRITCLHDSVIKTFQNCTTKFKNVHLLYINDDSIYNEDKLIEFFSISNIHLNLKCLIIENIKYNISIKLFHIIFEKLQNLIEIKFLNSFLNKPHNNEFENLFEHIRKNSNVVFKNLKSLELGDKNMEVLFSQIKNLTELHLTEDGIEKAQNFIFQSPVPEIIKNNQNTLKYLSFRLRQLLPFISKHFFNIFLPVFNLKLEGLNLINFYFDDDKILKKIVDKSQNLEILNLEDCWFSSNSYDLAIQDILKLQNLKKLTLTGRVEEGEEFPNNNLNLVELKNIYFTDENCIHISQKYNNLTVLHFYSHDSSTHDIGIQTIIENCKNLFDLSISVSRYNQLTDYAFTGINIETKEKTGYAISHLDKLISLKLNGFTNLTKEILIHGIKFKNLKILHISLNCETLINLNEFDIMTKNSPSIEILCLRLSNFNNEMLHKLIEILFKNLCLLERIYIESDILHSSENTKFRLGFEFIPIRHTYEIHLRCSCEKCSDIEKLCENFLNSKCFVNVSK